MKEARIIIIGAGMGGLAAALAMQRAGFRVSVHEQAPELGEVGAGLTISPNATHAIEYLGIGKEIAERAVIPERQAMIHYRTGKILVETKRGNKPKEQYGADYYQMHRADLHSALTARVTKNDSAAINLNHSFVGCQESDDGVTAFFNNGDKTNGDVLIGCDGARSAVRSWMFGPEAPKFTGNIAWRGLVPTDGLSKDATALHSAVAIAPRKAFTRYIIRGGTIINYVAFSRKSGWKQEGWSIRSEVSELLEEFDGWHPLVSEIIAGTPPDQCFKWALFDRDPIDEWTKGSVSLLGDAAHPMLPFLGMGAAMALEDGVVLARAFEASGTIEEALKRYERARKERCNFVLLQSRVARERIQGDQPEEYDDNKHKNEESLGLFDYNPGSVAV